MSFISSYLLGFLLYFYFPSVISNPLPYHVFVPSFNFFLAYFFNLFLVHIVTLPAAFFLNYSYYLYFFLVYFIFLLTIVLSSIFYCFLFSQLIKCWIWKHNPQGRAGRLTQPPSWGWRLYLLELIPISNSPKMSSLLQGWPLLSIRINLCNIEERGIKSSQEHIKFAYSNSTLKLLEEPNFLVSYAIRLLHVPCVTQHLTSLGVRPEL